MLGSYEEELRKSRIEMRKYGKAEKEDNYGEPRFDEERDGVRSSRKRSKQLNESYNEEQYTHEDVNGSRVPLDSRERNSEPYLTFPGHLYGGYPPGYGNPGQQQGHDPITTVPGMHQGYFPQYYPPYYPRRPLEPFGVTAMTLGIVAMCIFWLSVFPDIFGTMLFVVVICIAGISIIFGGYSFASKRLRSTQGLVGLILSIIALILSSIMWSFSHINYY